MSLLPLVRPLRLSAWARRRGIAAAWAPSGALVLYPSSHPGLRLEAHLSDEILDLRLTLTGRLGAEDVERLIELAERIGSRTPAPTVCVVTDEPGDPDGADGADRPEGASAGQPQAAVRAEVVLDVSTAVSEGLTDTQIEAFADWAVPFLASTGAEVRDALPLEVMTQEEDS